MSCHRKNFVDYGGPSYSPQEYSKQFNRPEFQNAKQHCFDDVGKNSWFSGPKKCSGADKQELVTQIVWAAQNQKWTPEQFIQHFIDVMTQLSTQVPNFKLDRSTVDTLRNQKLTISQALSKIPTKYLVAYVI